jgi:hypothetical protein
MADFYKPEVAGWSEPGKRTAGLRYGVIGPFFFGLKLPAVGPSNANPRSIGTLRL